uniref:Septin 5 n=1 Tax=Anas platyrhynchos platyrhynchos TaxID=8840 RepID=U3J9F2_ANAPP
GPLELLNRGLVPLLEHFRFTPALSCLLLKQYRQLSPKITPSLILTRAQQRGAARCASGAHRPGCAAGGSRREPGLPPALGRRRLRRRLPSAPSSSSRCFSPLPRCPGAGTVPGGGRARGVHPGRGRAEPSRAVPAPSAAAPRWWRSRHHEHRHALQEQAAQPRGEAGESGLGKSTLVNSLFLTDLYKDRKLLNAEERINQTVEIVKHTVDIEEKGVKLKLTIVDTPGFGDAVNNTECWKPITDYIDQQFEQYFRDESGLNRKNIQDNRVHCCLYFISPFGHGLRPVDVEFMKALHEKVNIVPLIAKADCLIPSEIRKLKERIREEIEKFGIKVYQFPECDSDEDEEFKQQDRELKESAPFAVIGSNTVVEAKGQRVRGRLYPWGIVEVENQAHCDFVKLRNMLIRTHMHDLKDVTCDVHYENYRAQCIQQMTSKLTQDNRIESPIPILPLPTPDTETEKLIKMKDEELRRMQEMLQKMQQQMQDQ